MMTGTGKPGRVELSVGDHLIAVMNDRKFGFELGEVGYTVKRSGVVAMKYQLFHCGGAGVPPWGIPQITKLSE